MRIAVTTGALKVPPTYFVVDHAQRLRTEHEFEVFALVADVSDPAITIPVHGVVPLRGASFERRMPAAPLGIPLLGGRIRRFQPDLIHQHFATWSGPAISAGRKGAKPILTTVHGYDILLARRNNRSLRDRWNLANVANARDHSNRVLAVSEFLAGEAVAAGFDPTRLEVHYQGVDTEYFTPLPGTQHADSVPVVAFVGALAERKGIMDLIAASNALIGAVDHRLVIMGGGPLASAIQAEAARTSHIDVLGTLPRAEIRAQLRRATLMALPTQEHDGWREAAGLVLVEAQACGTPVVAYRSGGTPEMVDENRSGLLVAEKDVAALTSAIRDVLALGSEDYLRMRHAAREFAHEHRSLDRSCRELLAHYAELT
ncbi:glycosyltransferase involved in cell wall biosynthesis [Cryobacterium mesophilum]|uniref:glycosyltransferase n=1 Tax=Terrimesophilobacter mesophilus TaxID=433647 RepID=UPI00142555E9|nr:glycosyltransferase [Terrimesophilobacter mesophilus]MBB5632667.1 glycosyltransferase involved in cell wall biosynthesis [Terrimesophilobacter mesophilus]